MTAILKKQGVRRVLRVCGNCLIVKSLGSGRLVCPLRKTNVRAQDCCTIDQDEIDLCFDS